MIFGTRTPPGYWLRDGALYVAAVSTILRFDDIESRLDDPPAPVIVTDRLPSEGHHGWKVLEFGPDGLLYLPVGAPCDVCRTEGYHGTILRMRPNGSGIEIYARGLRNSVGLAWHPVTGELWFLSALPRPEDNPWVIVGKNPGAHLTDLQKPWRRIRARAGLDDVRIHDLRHSFASRALALGESLPMIGKLLGHTQVQTTARYAHLANESVKASGSRVGDSIGMHMVSSTQYEDKT